MEGRTLLPITPVHHAVTKPGPSGSDEGAVSPSSFQQTSAGTVSSSVSQNSVQSTSSRDEDPMPAIIQCDASNELSEEREVDILKEMFPDLNEEQVKQALEFADSDLSRAINKVLVDTGTETVYKYEFASSLIFCLPMCYIISNFVRDHDLCVWVARCTSCM